MSDATANWKDNPLQWVEAEARLGTHKAEEALGGKARTKVVVLLACVLGLDTADKDR